MTLGRTAEQATGETQDTIACAAGTTPAAAAAVPEPTGEGVPSAQERGRGGAAATAAAPTETLPLNKGATYFYCPVVGSLPFFFFGKETCTVQDGKLHFALSASASAFVGSEHLTHELNYRYTSTLHVQPVLT